MDGLPARYRRNLGTFTAAGQKKLLAGRALVVGLGGLGGHVVELLARAGMGTIHGCDPDVFDEDNLNRQPLCTVDNIGQPKTEAARRRLRQVNPSVEFVPHAIRFQQLPDGLLANMNLVFDCLDTMPGRIELERRCGVAAVPLVHAAIGGWYGQVGVSWPGARLLERIYRAKPRGIEKELGNPPFTPAVAASLMAAKGLQVLLGEIAPGQSRLQFFDLLADDWQNLPL